jgi:hypothetical protein
LKPGPFRGSPPPSARVNRHVSRVVSHRVVVSRATASVSSHPLSRARDDHHPSSTGTTRGWMDGWLDKEEKISIGGGAFSSHFATMRAP